MILEKIIYPKIGEFYNKEIISEVSNGIQTICGTVFLKKGTRIPEKGFSKHPNNEISIISKGAIAMLNENEEIIGNLSAGMVVFIKAHEAQAGLVLEDTELIYVLNKMVE